MWIFILLHLAWAQENCPTYVVSENKVEYVVGSAKQTLPGANYAAFSLFPPQESCSPQAYGRDDKKVYFNGKVVDGADPLKLVVDPIDDRYAHDAEHAYWLGKKIAEAEGRTFKAVTKNYAHDSHRAFFKDLLIPESDPESFAALNTYFARDRARVFVETEAYPFQSYRALGLYTHVGQKVFYKDQEIPDVDSFSFSPVGDCFAKDRAHAYAMGTKMEDVVPTKLRALAPKSKLAKACTDVEHHLCCAEDDVSLFAFVREGTSDLKLVRTFIKQIKVGPPDSMTINGHTYKALVSAEK